MKSYNGSRPKFMVTRQKYYYSGESVVEVTSGGFDYAGADCLSPKYPGECTDYEDPVEAVEVAITILRAWRIDGEKKANIAVGCTGGMGMELEPCTFKDARDWAKKWAAKITPEEEPEDEDWNCLVQDVC